MRTLGSIVIAIIISIPVMAQNYDIKSEAQRVNNKKYEGVSSLVEAEFEKVERYWLDYLREYGKLRRKRNYYQLTEFRVQDLGVDSLTYVTRIDNVNNTGLLWLAPFDNSLSDEQVIELNKDLEKILKMSTRGYYVSEVQEKIDEAEAAAVAVSKSHQKLIYEGEKLTTDLEGAEELKIDLQTRLEETELKIKVLTQQIIDNQAAIDSVYNDLEAVKKVIEAHKESMKKIK